MLDELAGGLFRLLGGLFKDIFFDVLCFLVGWITLRVLTLGQYPRVGLFDGMRHETSVTSTDESLVSIVGLLVIIAAVAAFAAT